MNWSQGFDLLPVIKIIENIFKKFIGKEILFFMVTWKAFVDASNISVDTWLTYNKSISDDFDCIWVANSSHFFEIVF